MSFYGSKFGFYETTQESTIDDGRTFDFDQDLDGDKEFRSSVDEATVIVWSALNMQRMFEAVDIDIDEALSGFDEGSALAPIYTNKKDDSNSSDSKSDSGEKKQDDAGETLRKSKLKKAFNTILQKLQNAISIVFNKISELITRACNRLAYWSNKMSTSVWLKSNKSKVIEAAKNSNKKFSTAEFDPEGFNQMIQNVEDNHFTILARTAGSNFDQLSRNIHNVQQDTKVDKFDAGFGRVALLMFMSAIKDNKPAQSQLNSIMRGSGEITYDNLRSVIKYNLSKNADDVDAATAADKSIKEIENIPKYIHGIEQVRVLITKFKNQTDRAINTLRRELNNNDLFTGEDKTKEIRNCITIYRSICTNAWSIEFTLCSGALECVSNCKWIAQETCKALLGKQTVAEPEPEAAPA